MDEYFVILGGHLLNRGVYDKLKSLGLRVITVGWHDKPFYNEDIHLQMDYTSSAAIIARLEQDGLTAIQGAFASVDLAVGTINEIHRHFGLKHLDHQAIRNSADKASMTCLWESRNLLNRTSVSVKGVDLEVFRRMQAFDSIIVKPNKNGSSRGITILDRARDPEAFETAAQFALANSFDDSAVIEEFAQGQEFTVEMLGDDEGHVAIYGISVKYHTVNTVKNKIAVKLHYNSGTFPTGTYERIAQVGSECYRALGLNNCFGHLEIILKPDGTLTPLEIGARSSGFIASHLASIASGRDFFQDYVRVLQGAPVEDRFYRGDQASMYFFYDLPADGTGTRETDLTKYLNREIVSLYHDRSNLVSGKQFANISSDNERYGFEILSGPRDVLTFDEVSRAEAAFLRDFLGR